MSDFIAVDVETANENFWSICQIGLAFFSDGKLSKTWKSLVNPETYFDDINIEIHGITPKMVRSSIKLPEMMKIIRKMTFRNIVVHHTIFDRSSLNQCAEHFQIEPMDCFWLDSARVARRTWADVRNRGYGLADLSAKLGVVQEKPHDALDDAITAGKIILKAIEASNISLDDWLSKAYTKQDSSKDLAKLANSDPDPDGPLFGEVVVFTGSLSITRLEAAQIAYGLGCNIDTGVTRNTTILVLGDQNIRQLAGYSKSSKHRKAEELISKGQKIRIIGENDFSSMLKNCECPR